MNKENVMHIHNIVLFSIKNYKICRGMGGTGGYYYKQSKSHLDKYCMFPLIGRI